MNQKENKPLSILFVGESVIAHTIEYKGHDSFSCVRYGESATIMKELFLKLGHNFTHIPCHLVPDKFPRDIDELKKFDVVLFSDVGSNTFLLIPEMVKTGKRVPNLLKLVQNYVEDGGGFGMIGGYMTFQGMEGKGKWKDSYIEEILPVNLIYGDDRVEVPEGVDLNCNPSSHPILNGLPSEWPYILGYNKLIPKADANILVSRGKDPIISVSSFGKGRTLAYATDCTPHWAPSAMYEWEYYDLLWNNILNWLSGEK